MSASPPVADRAKAAAAAVLHPAKLDAFIVHLNKVMQTPNGIDAVLAAVCYGARLGSVVLSTAGGRALLHEPVRQLASVLLALPARAGALVILTNNGGDSGSGKKAMSTATAAKAAAGASALVLAQRLRALGSLLTEARMMLRLWGLLSMYVWARQLLGQLLARRSAGKMTAKAADVTAAPAAAPAPAPAPAEATDASVAENKEGEGEGEGEANKTEAAAAATDAAAAAAAAAATVPTTTAATAAPVIPPSSTAETLVGWTQLISCVAYQVTENAAYLASKGVLGASPAQQGKLYRWSSRAFSVFIAAELGRLVVQFTQQATDTPEKKAQAGELHKNLVRYASLAPITAHWSMENGFLGDTALTVLGGIPAAIQMHRTWTQA
ncbi:MAG: hypothetical protein STHCBS139747_003804 [Sporothrix thermara]